MEFFKKTALAALVMGFSGAALALPNITILATGGAIAGGGDSATKSNYTAGKVGVENLVNAVPQLKDIANVKGEQVVNIGSQDMNDNVWLTLAKKINTDCDKTDGFVITHGTDTMEETAYFLDLTVKCDKPVVMVGAMRPSTSMSADGPFNLYNAVVTAADKASANRGVLVVMNDTVLDGRDVTKTNTTDVATFKSVNYGPLGYIHNGKIDYQRTPARKHTSDTPFDVSKLNELPKVGIVYNYANASDLPAKALVDAGYDGIVSAGVGNGNLYKSVFAWLRNRGKEPSTPMKIAIGMGIAAFAYVLMVFGSLGLPKLAEVQAQGGLSFAERVTPWLLVATYLILTIAELFISPLGLSFVSKVAPQKLQGLMQGCWLGATALGNGLLFIGPIIYKRISISATWSIFVIVCAISMFAMLLLWRGITIAAHAPDRFGALLVVGFTVQVALQAVLNVAVVTNTIPNTGISLPFFSSGGTSLMMLLGEMGIVLSVSRGET